MFRSAKSEFLLAFGVHDWLMHLTLGLAFYAIVFAATRMPWFSLWLLLLAQLGNETVDLTEQTLGVMAWRELIYDTLWTMAMPFAVAGCLAAIQTVALALGNRQ